MKEAQKFKQELELKKNLKIVLFADDKEVIKKAEDIFEYKIHMLNQTVEKNNFKILPRRTEGNNLVWPKIITNGNILQ